MKFIGITGGVGAGKSEILHYIEREYPARILLADELAHTLMLPGTDCFCRIKQNFEAEDIFTPEGLPDASKMAQVIFSDAFKREKMNAIVHPAVKQEILRLVKEEKEKGVIAYFILEAALLIEDGYDKICDELWYIYTSRENRRERLRKSRGYTDEKIDAIFDSQLPEETYRKYCQFVIDNNGTLKETFRQINQAFAGEKSGHQTG